MASAIDEYLVRLDRELRLRRAPRRRLLAEAGDHLRSSTEELGDERSAVTRFGDAATVAERFAHAAAATSARRSATWVALALAGYVAAATAFAATAGPEFADFPQGAPSALALQFAAVAAVVGLLHSRRPETRLRVLRNAAAVGAAALTAGLVLELAVALTRPAGILPWDDLALVTVLFAASIGAALAAVASAAAAAFRTSRLPMTEADDNLPLPKALVGVVAAAALIAVFLSQVIGTDFAHHASIVFPAFALGLLEALLILAGYATLGRSLGLRRAA